MTENIVYYPRVEPSHLNITVRGLLLGMNHACRFPFDWHRRFRLRKRIGYLDCLIGAAAFCSSTQLVTLTTSIFRPTRH